MFQTAFDTSYTAMDLSGAKWITQHTDVKLVGIDYLSIAVFDNTKDPHVTLFQKVGRDRVVLFNTAFGLSFGNWRCLMVCGMLLRRSSAHALLNHLSCLRVFLY